MKNDILHSLKPYYRKGNRYFFRYKKQKMVIEKVGDNHYVGSGDLIQDRQLQIISDERINYSNVKIDVV